MYHLEGFSIKSDITFFSAMGVVSILHRAGLSLCGRGYITTASWNVEDVDTNG